MQENQIITDHKTSKSFKAISKDSIISFSRVWNIIKKLALDF